MSAIDTLTLLADRLRGIGAATVLDIGCGGGEVAKNLSGAGFAPTGIDPSEAAIATARAAVSKARFEVAGAEHLPFEAGTFDAALFHNSLHHVPVAALPAALAEAARVVRQEGAILVVEPDARGGFFETMRPIEDESGVRAAARAAVDAAVVDGVFELIETHPYERIVTYRSVDDFFAYTLRVDANRAAAVARERDRVTKLFEANGEPAAGGMRFRQPQTLWVLRPRAAA